MTDRLAELREGYVPNSVDHEDIETGLDAESEAILAKFNREADAIDKVYVWADKSVRTITAALSDPDALPSVTAQLDTIETKLDAVRKRLKRIAVENKELAAQASGAPSSLRIRVARYTKLGRDFMDITTKMETVRESHRNVVADGVKKDILRANPHATERQVERAMADDADLDAVLQTSNSQLRHQVDDLRARNKDIQNLSKSIVELHQMFTDMNILVEAQQELVNNVEYNVKEVKADTGKAAEELVEARRHQKSARKKKMCIVVLVILIIVGIAAGILIPLALKNGWFSGGDDNDSDSSSTNQPALQPVTPGSDTTDTTTGTTGTTGDPGLTGSGRMQLFSPELFAPRRYD